MTGLYLHNTVIYKKSATAHNFSSLKSSKSYFFFSLHSSHQKHLHFHFYLSNQHILGCFWSKNCLKIVSRSPHASSVGALVLSPWLPRPDCSCCARSQLRGKTAGIFPETAGKGKAQSFPLSIPESERRLLQLQLSGILPILPRIQNSTRNCFLGNIYYSFLMETILYHSLDFTKKIKYMLCGTHHADQCNRRPKNHKHV